MGSNYKNEIIFLAKKNQYYCDLLISQSNNWLPEDVGIKNTEKRILQRETRKKRKIFFSNKCIITIICILLFMNFTLPMPECDKNNINLSQCEVKKKRKRHIIFFYTDNNINLLNRNNF